jgi:hypothetical protein
MQLHVVQFFVYISLLSVFFIHSTAIEKSAILKLKNAVRNFSTNRTLEPSSHFSDIQNSIVWNISDTHFSDGKGQGSSKFFVYSNEIKRRGKDFIVYSAGNNSKNKSSFCIYLYVFKMMIFMFMLKQMKWRLK